MTPNKLEASDAMIADRDRWREKAEQLAVTCYSWEANWKIAVENNLKLYRKNVRLKNERDKARQQRDELQQWKNDQMTVNSEWDMQTVGKLLNLRIGESITLNIEPKIRELINQRDRLEEALRDIANGTKCQECGGEDQARFAREAL